jgi:hypothetical protein
MLVFEQCRHASQRKPLRAATWPLYWRAGSQEGIAYSRARLSRLNGPAKAKFFVWEDGTLEQLVLDRHRLASGWAWLYPGGQQGGCGLWAVGWAGHLEVV